MFILSSISIGLEFWPVNHTPIWKNSESNTFKKVKFLDEVSNNHSNNFLEKMYKKPLNFVVNYYLQCHNVLIVLH